MTEYDDKQDRKERYQRRRAYSELSDGRDQTSRRRAPYKRQRNNYDDGWEEDEAFYENLED